MADMRLLVVGAAGRMGRTLVRLLAETPGVTLAGAIERIGAPEIGKDSGELAGVGPNGIAITADALPLFAKPRACSTSRRRRRRSATPSSRRRRASSTSSAPPASVRPMKPRSGRRPRMRRSSSRANMSVGVNLLAGLVRQAAKALGDDFDIEILEMHHRAKVDAPSGTALMLGEAAAEGRGIELASHSARGRDGQTGARKRGDIGFASLRGGAVIGEHSVIFASDGETIEITHKATDRALFARGAIRAALWGRGQKPGLYSMTDVLGL